ncbi:PD-(D/E)XK motif protein [Campylobacter gastrosuis]|uniref:PD-(D/E)XK motif protein n=1 Tax=Campylobacter gastrosuis TaxID=2974576 RepID=A0ABT7HRZ0_9BACT|nr:PD-(D/E)XK motif protein [Campylobacter gastrosuis]MDL0089681.1 PD-(D/E)XK motif protein [Campylobacter gastrosuis]
MINPWQDMQNNTKRRVYSNSSYNIFWIVDLNGRYAFGIELDFYLKTNRKGIKFNGLTTLIKKSENTTNFYIALNDNSNWQLFKLVCDDIILLLNTHKNNKNVIDNVETRLLKWRKIFVLNIDDDFGIEKQMGLFGELSFLNDIASSQVGFEQALDSWVGASFDKQDFIFNDCAVEIKTYKTSRPQNITISSAYQLYTNKEKLYLVAYALSASNQGFSVKDIVESVEAKITDIEAFYKKLFLYGYKANDQSNLQKFKIDKILFFNVNDKFPKIVTTDIDHRICDVKYTINLLKCNEFLLDQIKL